MKPNIHPTWFDSAKVVCGCGATFVTGSTTELIKVDICSKCHPFFTGQQKFIDTLGQVDRFQRKQEVAKVKQADIQKVEAYRAQKVQDKKTEKPSLRDLLLQARKQSAN